MIPVSFAYGYPQHGTWPSDYFEFYFANLPLSDPELSALRKDLLTYGIFREAGKKTLRVLLDDESIYSGSTKRLISCSGKIDSIVKG